MGPCNLQSVTIAIDLIHSNKKIFPLYKTKIKIKSTEMKKNSGEIFESIQVDPISGEYYIVIPEEIINDLSWYEDTEIKFELEGDEVILTERIN